MTATVTELDTVRVTLYGRQSHGSRASINQQLASGQARAAAEGWQVKSEYQDTTSASRHATRVRDDWEQILAEVRTGDTDVVWLWESSRGDRTLSSWAVLLESARANGVKFCIENHGARIYDMEVARDWRTLAEDGVDNEFESAKLRGRVMRDKDDARQAGKLRAVQGGSPPVGFRDGADDWETDPEHAAVLRDVAARVLAGEPLRSALKDQPVITTNATLAGKGGGQPVNEKMIRAALRRPATAGLATGRDGKITGPSAVSDPPLPEATWERLAALFASRQRGRTTTDAYPLGKILRCAKCGNQLSGGPIGAAATPGYGCKNAHKLPGGGYNVPCRGVSIQAAQLHDLIRAALQRWAAQPRTAAAVSDQAGLTERQAELDTRIRQAQELMADLADKRIARQITPERYARSEAALAAELASLRHERDQAEAAEELPAMPAEVDWPRLGGAELRALAGIAFETPIEVRPGRGGQRPLSAAERVTLRVREG